MLDPIVLKLKTDIGGIDSIFYIENSMYCTDGEVTLSATLKPYLENLANEDWFISICNDRGIEIVNVGFIFNRPRLIYYLTKGESFSNRIVKSRYKDLLKEIHLYIKNNNIEIHQDNIIQWFLRKLKNIISM